MVCVALPPGRVAACSRGRDALYRTAGFRWQAEYTVILALIFILASIRGLGFGVDYRGYYEFYDYIRRNGEFWNDALIGHEAGYQYLNLWSARLGVPGGIFFGALSAATWFFFFKGSYRYQYLLPLMLYFVLGTGFFFWTWNGVRQSVAIMIFFFAIGYIIEKKPLHYVGTILLASLFHLSVLAMIPMYFIGYVRYKRSIALVLYLSSILFIGYLSLVPLIGPIAWALDRIPHLHQYIHYLDMEQYQQAKSASGTNLGVVLKIAFTTWIIVKSNLIIKENEDFKIYLMLFMCYAILSNVFFSISLMGRLLNYFLICFPIVAAATIRASRDEIDRHMGRAFLSAFFLLYLVTTYRFVSDSLA